MEKEAQQAERLAGSSTLAALLAALPEEDTSAKPCPRCGKAVPVRGKKRARTVRTLSGKVTLLRNYHYCRTCKAGFCPRDVELGLPAKGALSRELEKRVLDFAVTESFEQGAERWSIHYPYAISANLLRRVADRVGVQCERARAQVLQPALLASPERPAELLVVQNDGGHVPLRGEWKEAKVGVLYRADNHLSGREAPRGHISQARYVAVLGAQEEFAQELRVALQVERAKKASRVAWIADGAAGNWHLAAKLCPAATQVLDWGHALQHGMSCAKVLLGDTSPLLPLWQERLGHLLMTGESDALVAELMACLDEAPAGGAKALDELVRYYRSHQRRMRYADFLAAGLPIGSGVVESAHKHVTQARMKRAGQHWSEARARRMLRMRAAYRTAGPHRFHACIHRAHARSLASLPTPPRPKRRYASNR